MRNKAVCLFLARTTIRDRILLINMVLFSVIGTLLLARLLLHGGPFLAYAIGFGLLSAGAYRGHQVYQIVRTIQRSASEKG